MVANVNSDLRMAGVSLDEMDETSSLSISHARQLLPSIQRLISTVSSAPEENAQSWCVAAGVRAKLVPVKWYVPKMIDKRLFEELNQRISEALRQSPAADLEKNLRALLAGWFDRFDLVSREDFDVQKKLLERAQSKLAELEARIAVVESHKTDGTRR